MNIKSLLLGSAAALLAVSGARAADAVVVAEPEPMEYVRICDVYGAGFYYIPGTETCLQIGGLVRYQINFDEDDEGFRKQTLARVHLDARSETEYGTFRRYIQLQGDIDDAEEGYNDGYDHDGTGNVFLRQAYFELGGLLVGLTDTLWDGDLSGEFDAAGGTRVNQIRYTFDAGNGIAVSIGLEEESNDFDYMPLVVGKVSISQGWGSVDLFAGYDDFYEEFALKGIAKIKATDALTVELLATYESGSTYFSNADPYIGSEWSLGGFLKYQVNEKLAIGAGGQYFADLTVDNVKLNVDAWTVGAVIDYTIVENLNAKLALNYGDSDAPADDGNFSGFLRLDASF
ncbi:porin [Aminobacter niigataensis]|uniref:porin n=1 Tax=Aminobacter niigataensis TaxID=83265 RepID=UPI0024C7ACFA|nr:porin [Aminobacter niigataensis]CAI2935613.1 Porin [Aminobacter niigataensis]